MANAKPLKMATLIPITSPRALAKIPPELPGASRRSATIEEAGKPKLR